MTDVLLVSNSVPLWLKISWTAMVAVIVVIYWRHRGPANFLWLSDVALLLLVPGLWLESKFIVSLVACMVFLAETLWSVSFFGQLFHLPRVTGIADYMFDDETPRWLRAVSLFHLPLLAVIVWGPWRLGYDPAVLPWTIMVTWLVLLLTRWLTGPERNVNHVYRLPIDAGANFTPIRHMLTLMTLVPLALQLPAHLLLWLMFGG